MEHRNNDGSRYWIYRSGSGAEDHVSNVGSTRRTSCRDALTIKTFQLPRFSVLATSFVPLPDLVLPTQAPLFIAGTNFVPLTPGLLIFYISDACYVTRNAYNSIVRRVERERNP